MPEVILIPRTDATTGELMITLLSAFAQMEKKS